MARVGDAQVNLRKYARLVPRGTIKLLTPGELVVRCATADDLEAQAAGAAPAEAARLKIRAERILGAMPTGQFQAEIRRLNAALVEAAVAEDFALCGHVYAALVELQTLHPQPTLDTSESDRIPSMMLGLPGAAV